MLSDQGTLLVTTPVDFFPAARRFILARAPRTLYTDLEVDYILTLYKEACLQGGVDLVLALTQMVHETAGLTSEWSQPPKRNPAGIGVTGALDPATGLPLGQFFPTWLDAAQAHIGLLLAYRFPSGEGTPAQKRLISVITGYRGTGIPRGVATTINEMAIKWAADPEYADKLVSVSAAIEKA